MVLGTEPSYKKYKKFSKKLVNIIEELLLDKTINKNNTQLIATVSDKEYIGESEKVLWI